MAKEKTILVTGALGQVGSELVEELRKKHGNDRVIATDLREPQHSSGPFEQLNVLDKVRLRELAGDYNVGTVYNLAALLSATAEQKPMMGWELNMEGHFNVLHLAVDGLIDRIFWPSSIAVFGPTTPRVNTPQDCIMDPTTVYGISKQAGERWNEWYHKKHGVDVRSIRYPGLVGYKAKPGGGTTDYAVDIFYQALENGKYESFLDKHTDLPMIFSGDAIRATIEVTEAPAEQINVRSSYNLAGMTFNPEQLSAEIKKHLPDFEITYKPDFRQQIAESWPGSIDDSAARNDWGWKPAYDTAGLVKVMLDNIK